MSGSGAFSDAPETLGRVLDRTLPVAETKLRDDARLTGLWGHDAVHTHLPNMKDHVIITYHGDVHEMNWHRGSDRLVGFSRPGSLTIIPEGHEGRWDIFGPITVSHLFLPHQRLVACADEIGGGRAVELLGRVGFDDPLATQIMQLLGRNPEAATEPAARLFVEQATDLVVAQLVRAHSVFGRIETVGRGGLAKWQVRKVTDFMANHLDESIGLDTLAQLVGLSRFHFCTAFRKATGHTPHMWLVRMRMDRAQRLLIHPDLPVTEVALAVGYETPSSFSAAFRKVTGLTPSDFRRQL